MKTRKRNLKKAKAYTKSYSLRFLDVLYPLKVKKQPRKIKKRIKKQIKLISKTVNGLTKGYIHTNYYSLPAGDVLGNWIKANKIGTRMMGNIRVQENGTKVVENCDLISVDIVMDKYPEEER